jgi:hypothetical protein
MEFAGRENTTASAAERARRACRLEVLGQVLQQTGISLMRWRLRSGDQIGNGGIRRDLSPKANHRIANRDTLPEDMPPEDDQ